VIIFTNVRIFSVQFMLNNFPKSKSP